MNAGSPADAAVQRIPLDWDDVPPPPPRPVARGVSLGDPATAGDFEAVARAYPIAYDRGRVVLAGLSAASIEPGSVAVRAMQTHRRGIASRGGSRAHSAGLRVGRDVLRKSARIGAGTTLNGRRVLPENDQRRLRLGVRQPGRLPDRSLAFGGKATGSSHLPHSSRLGRAWLVSGRSSCAASKSVRSVELNEVRTIASFTSCDAEAQRCWKSDSNASIASTSVAATATSQLLRRLVRFTVLRIA